MTEKELTELANNEEFQELVKKTEIGNKFKFNDRYFKINKCLSTLCGGCIFENIYGEECKGVDCVKEQGMNIIIKEISEIEYKWTEIAINQLKAIVSDPDEYHIIFDNQDMVEQHDFGIDKELRKKICEVMIDHYNKN